VLKWHGIMSLVMNDFLSLVPAIAPDTGQAIMLVADLAQSSF